MESVEISCLLCFHGADNNNINKQVSNSDDTGCFTIRHDRKLDEISKQFLSMFHDTARAWHHGFLKCCVRYFNDDDIYQHWSEYPNLSVSLILIFGRGIPLCTSSSFHSWILKYRVTYSVSVNVRKAQNWVKRLKFWVIYSKRYSFQSTRSNHCKHAWVKFLHFYS